AFLHKNHIALWDVIASCEIQGSADSSIKNAKPNDLSPILENASIRRIFVNGGTAKKLYDRHILPVLGRDALVLPSTSPANAAWSVERLIDIWKIIKE
ncbi:MAG: DNA-deoxyinosine glycosylase, partial [Clostridia bacterium]|nr:DNA-deoxyinosine glycosylase [Clostridia bacterium]